MTVHLKCTFRQLLTYPVLPCTAVTVQWLENSILHTNRRNDGVLRELNWLKLGFSL